jgi:hypothetical protein
MSITKRLLILLFLTVGTQRLPGQTYKQSITSWAPSSAGFESTASVPAGAEIRILVVTTGHTGHWQGDVVMYPESRGYAVNPIAHWPAVKATQVLLFRIPYHAAGRLFIQAGTPNLYLRPGSCTRHGEYDQLTFGKGWVLDVKVLHEF